MVAPSLFDALPMMPRPLPGGDYSDPQEASLFLSFSVLGEPVAKGRPRVKVMHMRGKIIPQLYAPKETEDYEGRVRSAARAALLMNKEADKMAPIDDRPLFMVVRVFVPVPASWSKKKATAALNGLVAPTSRPDSDNYLKMACDALNGIIYKDDACVTDMRVLKRYSAEPRMEIEVYL